jgi:hypothetical protein
MGTGTGLARSLIPPKRGMDQDDIAFPGSLLYPVAVIFTGRRSVAGLGELYRAD